MSEVYHLQVKLDKETKKILSDLAELDERKLSNYCKVILTNWAMDNKSLLDLDECVVPLEEKKVETLKKPLKRVSKKSPYENVSVEPRTETIKLNNNDSPKVTGTFGMA